MHQQVRVVPVASDPDLAKLLGVLSDAGVNLVAAGGGNIELGEEFAFVPKDDQFDMARDALIAAGYEPRILDKDVDFKLCWLENKPGQLLGCVQEATEENLGKGRVVKDILVGIEPEEGRIGVQVYSVEKSSGSMAEQAARSDPRRQS
jgi:hypothetical protein